jgi:hypothetical protein
MSNPRRATKDVDPVLSVVIAVREAEETVGRDVRRMADHLRAAGLPFEILAVNDGCCDNSLAVLRLVAAQVPQLRLLCGDASGRAYRRALTEARGELVALLDASHGSLPLANLGWALSRLRGGTAAIVFRGRCIVGRRLACLPALVRASGRAAGYEASFERQAAALTLEIVGRRPPRAAAAVAGLLGPVLRLLATGLPRAA